MTNNEYEMTQQMLVNAACIIGQLDLDEFLERINVADTLGAVLDPTLYRKGHRRLDKIKELARSAQVFKAKFCELGDEVILSAEEKA